MTVYLRIPGKNGLILEAEDFHIDHLDEVTKTLLQKKREIEKELDESPSPTVHFEIVGDDSQILTWGKKPPESGCFLFKGKIVYNSICESWYSMPIICEMDNHYIKIANRGDRVHENYFRGVFSSEIKIPENVDF